MPFPLDEMLVVGVASSALFDLSDSHKVFLEHGEDEYRKYQEEHLDDTLLPGVAFPFIRRLLSLNDLGPDGEQLVEVIVLSRNDPDTGLRVMRSLKAHDLAISRAIFMQGRSSHEYMEALNMSLFLSANDDDVRAAIDRGLPAGRVVGTPAEDSAGRDLRIAFDFDGVLTDDSSEIIMQASDLATFHENEASHVEEAMPEGLMAQFLRGINRIQDIEEDLIRTDATYNRRVHVAIVTARNAPAHERVVRTLKGWGLRVNDAFFLGGVEKARVLRVLRPHIFFDDQVDHLRGAANEVPSVHVPFGVVNAANGAPSDAFVDTEEPPISEPQDQPVDQAS